MFTYPEYYKASRGDRGPESLEEFYAKGVFNLGKMDPEFYQTVDSIAEQVSTKITKEGKLDKSGLLIDFSGIFSLDGVEKLGEHITPRLENELYHCNLYMDKIYCYRNVFCEKRSASWLWHWDNNPDEIFKIIIYLTDVDNNQGPFEYMVDENGAPIIKKSTRTGHDNWKKPPNGSRVLDNEIAAMKKRGGKAVRVPGKKGTVIVFNNNICHCC